MFSKVDMHEKEGSHSIHGQVSEGKHALYYLE